MRSLQAGRPIAGIANPDGMVTLHLLPTDELPALAHFRVRREFTDDEYHLYQGTAPLPRAPGHTGQVNRMRGCGCPTFVSSSHHYARRSQQVNGFLAALGKSYGPSR